MEKEKKNKGIGILEALDSLNETILRKEFEIENLKKIRREFIDKFIGKEEEE